MSKEDEVKAKTEEEEPKPDPKDEKIEQLSKAVDELRTKIAKPQEPSQPQAYTITSFPEEQWKEAETQHGIDREANEDASKSFRRSVVMGLNNKLESQRAVDKGLSRIETQLAIDREKAAMATDDPLYPKYRKEVDKFLADIPPEFLSSPDGRKRWLGKAFDFAKRSVKSPPARDPGKIAEPTFTNDLDTKTKGSYTAEEEEMMASHGVKPEDYDKIKHPYVDDGIMIRERPQEPKFG